MMDNRLFNVNGSGEEMLKKTLELVFSQEGDRTTCASWFESKEKGLVLLWCKGKGNNDLPSNLNAEESLLMVLSWLKGEFAKTVELSPWCEDMDHDGHNTKGWQVYCEDWGHVGNNHYAICAIKPAYMWLGK